MNGQANPAVRVDTPRSCGQSATKEAWPEAGHQDARTAKVKEGAQGIADDDGKYCFKYVERMMTNNEKLAWLAEHNAHLAQGGKLEAMDDDGLWYRDDLGPCWASTPEFWRKVPLPRKATIRVAYRWFDDGRFEAEVMHPDDIVNVGCQVKEIEVTEEA